MKADLKFKDRLPSETIAKIRSLLAAHGIETVESGVPSGVRNCRSMPSRFWRRRPGNI